ALTLLTTLAALPLLTVLALLTGLPLLSSLSLLAALSLLTALALTVLTQLSIAPAEAVELIAQARKIVHRAVDRSLLRRTFARAKGARRAADVFAKLLQIVGERLLDGIREIAAAELVGAALEAIVEIALIHPVDRATKTRRGAGLRRRKLARR